MGDINDKLLDAIKKKDADAVIKQVLLKCDVNKADPEGKTPVHICAEQGNYESLLTLLNSGGKGDIQDNRGYTPLHYAVNGGRQKFVNILVGCHFSNIETKNGDGFTPLQMAVKSGNFDMVKELIDDGARVDGVNTKEETALILAAGKGHMDMVNLLLLNGADLNKQDKFGHTPLIEASWYGQLSTVKLLIDKGAAVNKQNNKGDTALHLASSSGHNDLVKLLITNGANKLIQNKNGENPSAVAKSPMIKLLFSANPAPIKFPPIDRLLKTADLMKHIKSNNVVEVENLLKKTPDILEWQNSKNDTILHEILKDGSLKIHTYDLAGKNKIYHRKNYETLKLLFQKASRKALITKDNDGFMPHQYLDSRTLVDRIIKERGFTKSFDFDDFRFVRAVRDPFIQNPYSLYNESFADTEIRKLIRKSNTPTMSKEKALESGWQNRSTSLFDPMGKCFSYVGYGLDNPHFADVICACDYDFGSGFHKKVNIRYGKAYHFDNDKNQPRHLHLLKLRKVIREKWLDPPKNTNTMYPNNQDINEVTLDVKMDDKIKFIFYNQSSFVSGRNHFGINYTMDTRKVMATYLSKKFEKCVNKKDNKGFHLPLYTFSEGTGLKEEAYPKEQALIDLLKTVALKDNPQFLKDYNVIDFWRTFGNEVNKDATLKTEVEKYCKALIQSGKYNEGYPMYNIINCMHLCGIDNVRETRNWVRTKFANDFYHGDKSLSQTRIEKKILDLRNEADTLLSNVKKGVYSNVYPQDPAYPKDPKKVLPSPRSLIKKKITSIRGDLLMLEAYVHNKKITKPFVKDLKNWFREQTKKNGLKLEI